MSGEVFFKLMSTLIILLSTLITYIIIPYIKNKTTEAQQRNIAFWVKVAVTAAEQIFVGSKMGMSKKQYVFNFLIEKGIDITEDKLDTLIESAVYEMNKAIK